MKKRKNWTVGWAAFIPNVGHVYVEYVDGRATWLAGVRQPVLTKKKGE